VLAEPYRLQVDGDWCAAAERWIALGCRYEAALATIRVARQHMRSRGLRSIPVGPRAATRGHPLGLTAREHEVLELICAGCTNAEIAGRLVIAVRTVDHHVSAVLAKLGASTRTKAAAKAARMGLVRPGRSAPAVHAPDRPAPGSVE
jgi:DNA-binding NarL/FixJ family response regulator